MLLYIYICIHMYEFIFLVFLFNVSTFGGDFGGRGNETLHLLEIRNDIKQENKLKNDAVFTRLRNKFFFRIFLQKFEMYLKYRNGNERNCNFLRYIFISVMMVLPRRSFQIRFFFLSSCALCDTSLYR